MTTNNSCNTPTLTFTGTALTGDAGGTGVNNTGLTINLGTATTGYVLTSDSSGNATWQASGAGSLTVNGDSGSATPSAGALSISTGNSSQGCGSSVQFSAASATVSLLVTDIGGNTIIGQGSGNSDVSIESTGTVCLGYNNLTALNGGSNNVAIGTAVGNSLTSSSNNVFIGNEAGGATTGDENVAIGIGAGSGWASTEENNIAIGFNVVGSSGDSNIIRLGSSSHTDFLVPAINNSIAAVGPVLTYNTSNGLITKATGIATAPTDSNTATTAFGSTLTAGTPYHSPLSYDVLVTGTVDVTAATSATLVLGVGPSSTPSTNAFTPTFTLVTEQWFGFSAVVPAGYYIVVDSTGSPTIGSITIVATPL